MTKRTLLLAGVALILVAFALILLFNRDRPVERMAAAAESAPEFQPMNADALPETEEPVELSAEELALLEEEEEPINYSEDGMDPEDQPRTFYTQHFKPGELPDGFQLHNVLLTERGLELAPGKDGEPRIGMVESPPMTFEFDSNAFAPMWIDDLPEGTSVLVEVAVSPDGENWGMWHQADIDHDSYGQIAEFYPDGTPNPNYGYTPGGNFIWGNMTWKYFRYNVAFYSETSESPAMSSFRGYYQDSTLGKGNLAELNVPAEQTP